MTLRRRHALPCLLLALLGAALLPACGGSDGSDGRSGRDGANALVSVAAEAPGAHCANGGSRVTAGTDTNGNGVLDDSEVDSTQYLCGSGNNSSTAQRALIAMHAEPAGAHCTAGGQRVDAGLDANGNNVLDADEVGSTAYVCNGSDGSNGSNGSSGAASLVAITAEPAGAHCAYGGNQVNAGLDRNADGVLDGGEVSSTSYLCNPAPTGLAWVTVAGTTQQAAPDTGYLANNDAAPVVVTLPSNPNVGSVVRVSGLGAGGWQLVPAAGQAVRVSSLGVQAGDTWTQRDSTRNWSDIATSADGTKLVAAEYGGRLYTSIDAGAHWTPRDASRNWRSVASSADGTRLVAVVFNGQIYTSTDSGLTWTPRESTRSWASVASSADGVRLIAATRLGQLYTSTDGGASWTPRESSRDWYSVASSADGMKLVAVADSDQVYTSTDGGVSWTPRESTRMWQSVASSADGSKLVAAVYTGQLYTSTDSGVTWTPRENVRFWQSVSLSGDGQHLLASGGGLFTSDDGGLTWAPHETGVAWGGTAISADGSRMAAVMAGVGVLRTSASWTTMGSDGGIAGGPFDAVELQYLGNGRWSVLSFVGSLSAW